MTDTLSRRHFLNHALLLGASATSTSRLLAKEPERQLDFPLTDFHVHLSGYLPIERALVLSKKRGVRFGIVDHPGPNYTVRDDAALQKYIDNLRQYPVYVGLQPVYPGWSKAFSKKVLEKLDYVLMDAMTLPEKDGSWLRMWRADTFVEDDIAFMKRYINFSLQIMREESVDVFAWATFLPPGIARFYDRLWTKRRMQRLIDAAKERDIAIEINEVARVPSEEFIKLAKAAGLKFTFGTGARRDNAGRFRYCIDVARRCGLTKKDMFQIANKS